MKNVHRVCVDVLKCNATVSRDLKSKQVSGSAYCNAFDKEVLTDAKRRLQELSSKKDEKEAGRDQKPISYPRKGRSERI